MNAVTLASSPVHVVLAVRIRVADAVNACALDQPSLADHDGSVRHGVWGGVVEDAALTPALVRVVDPVVAASGWMAPGNQATFLNGQLLLVPHQFGDKIPLCISKHRAYHTMVGPILSTTYEPQVPLA